MILAGKLFAETSAVRRKCYSTCGSGAASLRVTHELADLQRSLRGVLRKPHPAGLQDLPLDLRVLQSLASIGPAVASLADVLDGLLHRRVLQQLLAHLRRDGRGHHLRPSLPEPWVRAHSAGLGPGRIGPRRATGRWSHL